MALLILTGAPGSPGVTTSALALALTWPRHVLLADCDRDPSPAVLAGYLRGVEAAGLGLQSVARAHRAAQPLDDELWQHTVSLAEGEEVERRFLPGFAQPAAVALFEGAWPALAHALAALDSRGIDVVVDAGRIGVRGLPPGLLAEADAVVAVTGSSLRQVAALRLHLPALQEQRAGMPRDVPLGLGVVGPGRPYPAHEVAATLGLEPWWELPHDATAAGVLLDGDPEPKRFRDRGFLARARSAAQHSSDRLDDARSSREVAA